MKAVALVVILLAVTSCSDTKSPTPEQSSDPRAESALARPSFFLSAETLKALPHVHAVEVTPAIKEPKRQIIHLLDWHFVHKEEFEADIKAEAEKAGESLTPEDIDREWEAFQKEVEAVQAEQEALLRELVKSRGLKAVYLERLAEESMADYRELAAMLKTPSEPDEDDPNADFMRQFDREGRMMLGAVSRVEGLKVLAAEDVEALEAANPVKDGKVQYDDAANERREDAIVRNVLASESLVAVLMMGGGHDLSDNAERIGGGQVEYVRVQIEAHRKAVGE